MENYSRCMQCDSPMSPNSPDQICKWCLRNADLPDNTTKLEDLIKNTLNIAKLRPEYYDVLINRIDDYRRAFTSRSADPVNNYEILEFVGDGIFNGFISWYFLRKFPFLDCQYGVKILARLKINYSSKKTFSKLADKLGFFDFINASVDEKTKNRPSLLEDTLEAFVGTTVRILDDEFVVGVGYGVVYQLLKAMFDKMYISLDYDKLYDPKTRLKEIFDAAPKKSLGDLVYVDEPTITRLYRNYEGKREFLGKGENYPTKPERQQAAALQALKLFTKEESVLVQRHDQILFACTQQNEQRQQ